jgi:hypothetical protein
MRFLSKATGNKRTALAKSLASVLLSFKAAFNSNAAEAESESFCDGDTGGLKIRPPLPGRGLGTSVTVSTGSWLWGRSGVTVSPTGAKSRDCEWADPLFAGSQSRLSIQPKACRLLNSIVIALIKLSFRSKSSFDLRAASCAMDSCASRIVSFVVWLSLIIRVIRQ